MHGLVLDGAAFARSGGRKIVAGGAHGPLLLQGGENARGSGRRRSSSSQPGLLGRDSSAKKGSKSSKTSSKKAKQSDRSTKPVGKRSGKRSGKRGDPAPSDSEMAQVEHAAGPLDLGRQNTEMTDAFGRVLQR